MPESIPNSGASFEASVEQLTAPDVRQRYLLAYGSGVPMNVLKNVDLTGSTQAAARNLSAELTARGFNQPLNAPKDVNSLQFPEPTSSVDRWQLNFMDGVRQRYGKVLRIPNRGVILATHSSLLGSPKVAEHALSEEIKIRSMSLPNDLLSDFQRIVNPTDKQILQVMCMTDDAELIERVKAIGGSKVFTFINYAGTPNYISFNMMEEFRKRNINPNIDVARGFVRDSFPGLID